MHTNCRQRNVIIYFNTTQNCLSAGQRMGEGRRLFASTGDNRAAQVAAAALMASSWPGSSLNDRNFSHQQVTITQAHQAQEVQEVQEDVQAEAREEEVGQHEQEAGANKGEPVEGSAVDEQTRAADCDVKNGLFPGWSLIK